MGDCDFWEKSCVIYVITNRVNDMKYVGQTRTKLKKRVSHHKRNNEAYLGNAIRCYGWDNFEVAILEECSSPEELDEREKYWIKALNCKIPNGYNLTDGGNTPKGRYVSEHERMLRAEINPYKRAVRCIDTGEIFPSVMAVERRFKVGHSTISAVCRGKQITAAGHRFEYVDSDKEAPRFIKPRKTNAKRVRCVETNEIFSSIKEAARHTKAYPAHIAQVCRGQLKRSGGYHWEYVD